MASRENQGLQLSLIFFVAVTVGLSVACYVFWKKADEARTDAATNANNYQQAQAAQQVAVAENRQLKLMLGGYAAETPMTDIQADHEQDMAVYGQILQQGADNYRTLITLFTPEVIRISEDIVAAERNVQTLTDDVAAARDEESSGVQQFQAANTDLDEQFSEDLAELQEPTQAMQDFADTTNAVVDAIRAGLTNQDSDEIEALKATIAYLEQQFEQYEQDRDRLSRQLASMRDPTVDGNDGQVTWVNPDTNKVNINVGSDDYLQRQMTFNIYDANASNLATAQPKGSIEVTAVLGPHLAEASITNYNLEDPILSGDLIFSPIWQPGQQLRFALLGKLDIDGDGDDDTEMVERLITLNGGVVEEDALLGAGADEDDPLYGPEVDINTRYLVVGELLADGSDERALLRNNIVLATADQYHVEQIPLDRLLSLMGFRGSERSVGLGRYADPDDFRPRPGDGNFRERRPSGAFP